MPPRDNHDAPQAGWRLFLGPAALAAPAASMSRRKRKCDKQIPCSRCRRLKLNCSVETVRLRRDAVQHASEIQFLESLLGDLDSFSTEKLPQITQKLRSRITRLQTGDAVMKSDQPEQPEQPVQVDSTAAAAEPVHLPEPVDEKQMRSRFAEAPSDNTDPPLLTAIEHLAWGRNSAGCYPHRRCGCQYRRDSPEFLSLNSASFQIFGSALESMVDFPRTTEAQKLIKFHVYHLAWHHNCFHGPTFLQQCEVFWTTGRCDHPLWAALYFAVLSCTINSIQNSHKLRLQVDVNLDGMQTTQQLFSAMVQTMYSSHFLNNISIYSVQAVVISTEVAHNLGLSQLNATLFNAAVRIAECLGLHKIKDHPAILSPNRDQWEERVEREVGRRVWCQMIIQDHFAIPFTDTYSISPMHYSTSRPMNADDYNLVEMPASIPTISTYVRVLVNLAALMPDLCDGLGPMDKRKPPREQYERILQVDQKMRTIVQNIPPFLLRPDKQKEAQIPWLRIARRSLAITAAEKIIMVHRPFLFHSFHDPRYTHTRRTCVAAAMTILREHETIVEEDDLSIWTHSAFAITAAVILCFEVSSIVEEADNAKKDLYRDAVISARDRLALRHSDVLAQRGVALIDAIFISEGSSISAVELKPGKPIDFNRIFANFSTLSKMNPNADVDDMSITKLLGSTPEGSGSAGFDADEMALAWNQEEIDFDAWFNGVFNTLQTSPLDV
ncbi:hypothetical protein N7532_009168 [Penicillium argentinense]|uniref:Zn(2)-C6 fungal-type domain-containing protein n=1 Tax=Penicillium argentinense TaxID=1131581 RepID=A0A9W9EYQ0_9EURO|nr:uncharacterized protein N7532_009168 [Penicillium argentinense]KAJ5090484.1 hypothetical protein N7532_009168 [Penicillium argentinense]